MLDEARKLDSGGGDFVEFVTAGAPATGAFHCSGCGYGVAVQETLPQCPMCGASTWEAAPAGAHMPPEPLP